jgi:hypothetical protein
MSFETKISQWVKIDDQLKSMNETIKQLRETRSHLETSLNEHVKTNNMSNRIIQINNNKLKFAETKIHEPLTFKYLEKTLGEIIKNDAHVTAILEQLKQKRSYKMVPEIKRSYID